MLLCELSVALSQLVNHPAGPVWELTLFNPKTAKFCTLKLELKAMVRIVKVSSAWNFSSEAIYPKRAHPGNAAALAQS